MTRGLALVVALGMTPVALRAQFDVEPHRAASLQLIQAALRDSAAYTRLGQLVDGFGHRMSGSESLERAIDWIVAEMKRDGFENVRKEPVMVTHWVRGADSASAVSVEDAEMIQRLQDRGERIVVRLIMGARTLASAQSHNVVAEIRGSDRPDEVIVMGGHIDSWDVGQGAMDDGGGSVAAWEALRLIKQLGVRPKRTVRVVLWTNEEIGLAGANGYRDAHCAEIDKHMLAMESDNGVFRPRGIRFGTGVGGAATVQRIASLLSPIGADTAGPGGPQADISPLYALGVPVITIDTDGSRYFWYHHTESDTIDKLDPVDLAKNAAVLAVVANVVANMDGTLPRVK